MLTSCIERCFAAVACAFVERGTVQVHSTLYRHLLFFTVFVKIIRRTCTWTYLCSRSMLPVHVQVSLVLVLYKTKFIFNDSKNLSLMFNGEIIRSFNDPGNFYTFGKFV